MFGSGFKRTLPRDARPYRPDRFYRFANFPPGDFRKITHLEKWKHVQNGGHFVANIRNILKEFQPCSIIYTSFQYKNIMGNKLGNEIKLNFLQMRQTKIIFTVNLLQQKKLHEVHFVLIIINVKRQIRCL